MPFLIDVEELMQQRLKSDNKVAFMDAGKVWRKLRIGHYYLREDTADIVCAEIAMQAAALDNMRIPKQVLQLLQQDIGLTTIVDEAITRIFVATMPPEPM